MPKKTQKTTRELGSEEILRRAVAVDPDRPTPGAKSDPAAAEGSYDRGVDQANTGAGAQATGGCRACRRALGRFQHTRAVQPDHRINQNGASARAYELQTGVLPAMAR